MDDCLECKQPLVEIDNGGERLTGCMRATSGGQTTTRKFGCPRKICMRYKPSATVGLDERRRHPGAAGVELTRAARGANDAPILGDHSHPIMIAAM